MKHDIIIIGAGISGLMAAYATYKKNINADILIVEWGNTLDKRICPARINKTKCYHCDSCCSITNGIAGAGAFSDGKFIKSTEYGGWLQDYIGNEQTMKYINQLDSLLLNFGATEKQYFPSNKIKNECLKYDLHLQQAIVRHLGTDGNLNVMTNLYNYLIDKIEFLTNTKVDNIDMDKKYVVTNKNETIYFNKLIIAVGRSGSEWFSDICTKNNIQMSNNQVDVGVRVELPRVIWEDISKEIYEPKICYKTKQYGDKVRTFCFNSGGEVVTENIDGIITVNGHANSNEDLKTENSNFSILSTINFTQPFDEPIKYVKHIAKLGNMISGGGVLVQKFGDLINGRRTDEKRLAQSTVRPTLNAVAGDLSLCIPKRQLDNIIEMIYALDKLCAGTANYDTLLYGIEAKYYSAKPKFISKDFQIFKDIFTAGDCCSISRSLAQAGAMGMYIADRMTRGEDNI